METMTVKEFQEKAKSTMFTVCFIKRGNGERRVMNARLGVKKHLRGGPAAYNPADYDLLWCYDVKGNPHGTSPAGYKSINLQTVQWLKALGKVWGWDHKKFLFVEQDPNFVERMHQLAEA